MYNNVSEEYVLGSSCLRLLYMQEAPRAMIIHENNIIIDPLYLLCLSVVTHQCRLEAPSQCPLGVRSLFSVRPLAVTGWATFRVTTPLTAVSRAVLTLTVPWYRPRRWSKSEYLGQLLHCMKEDL